MTAPSKPTPFHLALISTEVRTGFCALFPHTPCLGLVSPVGANSPSLAVLAFNRAHCNQFPTQQSGGSEKVNHTRPSLKILHWFSVTGENLSTMASKNLHNGTVSDFISYILCLFHYTPTCPAPLCVSQRFSFQGISLEILSSKVFALPAPCRPFSAEMSLP